MRKLTKAENRQQKIIAAGWYWHPASRRIDRHTCKSYRWGVAFFPARPADTRFDLPTRWGDL